MSAGRLPAWATGDLPEPPRSTPRNTLRVIGRGAVLLAFSVGAGEWLLGPAAVAGYGATILWITTASVVLQALLNAEMGRYTLYTGEPIFTGFLRTAPGPTFWGWTYAGLHLLQIGWPGWALAAATAVTALFLGRVPDEGDRVVVLYFGYLTFLASVLLFSTQLGNTEGFARVTTDILWASNDRIRAWRGGNVRTVYYSALRPGGASPSR